MLEGNKCYRKKSGGKSAEMDQDDKDQITILNNIKMLMYGNC